MDNDDIDCAKEEIKCLFSWRENPHPSLLQMYHYFEDHQRLFLVTEICDGTDLYEQLNRINVKKFDTVKAGYIIK